MPVEQKNETNPYVFAEQAIAGLLRKNRVVTADLLAVELKRTFGEDNPLIMATMDHERWSSVRSFAYNALQRYGRKRNWAGLAWNVGSEVGLKRV